MCRVESSQSDYKEAGDREAVLDFETADCGRKRFCSMPNLAVAALGSVSSWEHESAC